MPFLLQAFQTPKKRCSANIGIRLTMCILSIKVPLRGFICAIVSLCVCCVVVCVCVSSVCVFCVCMCVHSYPALA